jgi:hypothetical protein
LSVCFHTEIERKLVFNLAVCLTDEYWCELIRGYVGHEDIGFKLFVDSRLDNKLAVSLEVSETLLIDGLAANHEDFSEVALA